MKPSPRYWSEETIAHNGDLLRALAHAGYDIEILHAEDF
jgi:hypothetical protein